MKPPILSIENLSKQFNNTVVLQSTHLDIYNGEFLTLLGPSGCGKTTLLRILAGFIKPNSGNIRLQGQNITRVPPEQRHINMVFQNYALFPHMTVFDNIAFGLRCRSTPESSVHEQVDDMLQRVRLSELASRKPDSLSGGQQQRVAIARAAINQPLLLLLDEPLSALDYHLRRNMQIELKNLQRRLGITFVLVTHDQEEALSMSDRVAVMNHGAIEQIGTPREIYETPNSLYVAQFIGNTNIFPAKVIRTDDTQLYVNIASREFSFKNTRHFQPNDLVNIIIRPEDIAVWHPNELDGNENPLPAKVIEVIYKGSTVDLIVELSDGHRIAATEFFDEDDPELEYAIGETVYIEWQPGWEVILGE